MNKKKNVVQKKWDVCEWKKSLYYLILKLMPIIQLTNIAYQFSGWQHATMQGHIWNLKIVSLWDKKLIRYAKSSGDFIIKIDNHVWPDYYCVAYSVQNFPS